jgi:hypothetical protein
MPVVLGSLFALVGAGLLDERGVRRTSSIPLSSPAGSGFESLAAHPTRTGRSGRSPAFLGLARLGIDPGQVHGPSD